MKTEHAHHKQPAHATADHHAEATPVDATSRGARFHAKGTVPPPLAVSAHHHARSPTDAAFDQVAGAKHHHGASGGHPAGAHARPETATPATAAAAGGELHLGDQGIYVAELQLMLQGQGLYHGSIGGHFGPQTEAALRAYQRAQGLPETGVGDAQTIARLRASAPPAATPEEVPPAASGGASAAIAYGMSVLGAPYAAVNPYRFGEVPWPGGSMVDIHHKSRGPFPAGTQVFDCSGFVVACWKHAGVDLLAHGLGSSDNVVNDKGYLGTVKPEELQPGDLIAYSGHIVMYVGNGQVIQSTPVGGVIVSDAGKYLGHAGAVCRRVPA